MSFGSSTPTFVNPRGDSVIAKKVVFRKRVFRKRMKLAEMAEEPADRAEGNSIQGEAPVPLN
jgi:hypothetical protein